MIINDCNLDKEYLQLTGWCRGVEILRSYLQGLCLETPPGGGRSGLSPPSCAHVCLSRKGFSIELDYLVTELAGSPRSLEVSPGGVCLMGGLPRGLGATHAHVLEGSPGGQIVPWSLGTNDTLAGTQKVPYPRGSRCMFTGKNPPAEGKKHCSPPWERQQYTYIFLG